MWAAAAAAAAAERGVARSHAKWEHGWGWLHLKKERPWFGPCFVVVKRWHGCWCPRHMGMSAVADEADAEAVDEADEEVEDEREEEEEEEEARAEDAEDAVAAVAPEDEDEAQKARASASDLKDLNLAPWILSTCFLHSSQVW